MSKVVTKDKRVALTQEVCCAIGNKIRAKRTERGLTQEALAEMADVSWKHLSSIENGREANISIGYLVAMSLALKVDICFWFDDVALEIG